MFLWWDISSNMHFIQTFKLELLFFKFKQHWNTRILKSPLNQPLSKYTTNGCLIKLSETLFFYFFHFSVLKSKNLFTTSLSNLCFAHSNLLKMLLQHFPSLRASFLHIYYTYPIDISYKYKFHVIFFFFFFINNHNLLHSIYS